MRDGEIGRASTETGIETTGEQSVPAHKILRNGVIIIERDGVLYDLLGNRIAL